jgi:tetratricopeptide (TPR) repeat protein
MSTDFDTRRREAESLYADKQWGKAETCFNALLDERSSDSNLIHDRAVCIFQLGRTKEALQEFNRAVELDPDNPYRYSSRAWIRASMKDVDGAIEDYKKALGLDPDDAIALNNLGLLEEQYGMRKSAQERFRRADTLMGILKDAGVDPAQSHSPESPAGSKKEEAENATSTPPSIWREVSAVFTNRQRRKEFLSFIRNGFRT